MIAIEFIYTLYLYVSWEKYITKSYKSLFFFGLHNDGNLNSMYILTKKLL